MARCSAFKPDGTACERIVAVSQSYCYAHDPNHAQARHRAASKAAKSKPNRELQTLKTELATLYSEVLEGNINSKIGAVAAQIANVRIRLLEAERKIREQEEIIERLERMEKAQELWQKEA